MPDGGCQPKADIGNRHMGGESPFSAGAQSLGGNMKSSLSQPIDQNINAAPAIKDGSAQITNFAKSHLRPEPVVHHLPERCTAAFALLPFVRLAAFSPIR